ncbi:hypothetical protein NM208_g8199 [Fusarium decemcellulare]|uniref:Uncharacterized protein n=1 Tax=Fusarium decemcellulare TaxID=57161 RepID=A0ACC1S6A8_9HYPO|nr:hypothetical protein NM208_g8199 [Fusarium decemcellulare]
MKFNYSLITLSLLQWTLAQKCYFPSGKQAPDKYKPCSSSNTTYSICCSSDQDDQCLKNGLCSWSDHYDYRAACTDEDWSGCQEICPEQKNGTWVQVKECASNEYCCNVDSKKDCCKNGTERFSLKSPQVTSSTSPTTGSSASSTPVGAIAGGVVGGVAAVVMLLGLGWWFLRRKRQMAGTVDAHDKDEGNETPPKTSPGIESSILEADAGPETVLVESDARQIQPTVLHELPA